MNCADQYYLVTHHDTLVYADLTTRRLLHASLGVAPCNLFLELNGGQCRLMTTAEPLSAERQLSLVEATGKFDLCGDRVAYDCQIQSFADDSVSIRAAGKYLAANSDGTVINDRDWCQEWERYRLVRADTVTALELLRQFSWVSHSDRRILSLADQLIDFGRDFPAEASALAATPAPKANDLRRELVFGPARFRLVGRHPTILLENTAVGRGTPPTRLHIVDGSGRMHSFSRYNPLVYYCVYGEDSYYDCLQLSLASLAKYGRYGGTVAVACDRPSHQLARYIPEAFHHRLLIGEASRERGWFNQYYLEHRQYEAYQPILYCDVDVVFDANITDVLTGILLSARICCATESHALPNLANTPPRLWDDGVARFFGRDLYLGDPEFFDKNLMPANAGVVGFDHVGRIKQVNDLVRMIAARQSAEQLRILTDQPILNYVLHKTKLGDFQVLDRYCRLSRRLDDVPSSERRGLAHFHVASGASDAAPKADLMRAYLQDLDRPLPQADDASVEINRRIPGRMDIEELRSLAKLARRVPPNGCIVELGSMFGLSSWTLAKNAHPSVTVYCVDPWAREPWMLPDEEQAGQIVSLETFRHNVLGVSNIVPLRGYSPQDFIGWQRTIDLLFDDSVHTNPVLHQNLSFWTRFVCRGGIVCGHDYCMEFPDVKAEADALAAIVKSTVQVQKTLWAVQVRNDPMKREIPS